MLISQQQSITSAILTNTVSSYAAEVNKQNDSSASKNFKVVVRVRPPLVRELEHGKFISTVFNMVFLILSSHTLLLYEIEFFFNNRFDTLFDNLASIFSFLNIRISCSIL